jgi:PAS domain S-box-containing protein
LFEGVPIGLYRTTPSGQILDINPALVHLLGYPNREMLMTVSVPDLYVNPGERSPWLARIEREGIVRDFEVQFRTYDGTIIWVRDTGEAVRDDSGQVVYYNGNVEDITESKQVEEALQETNEYLQKLIDYGNAPIVVWDPDFLITRFNHAFELLTGRSEIEVIGQPIECLIPVKVRDAARDLIKKTKDGERWETVEIPILAADDTLHTLLWNSVNILTSDAELVSTVAQGVDITERKRAEEALQASEQRYRTVVEDQTEFICRFLPDGRLTFINEAYCNYFRLNREECIGKRHSVLLLPDDAQQLKNHLAALTPENPVLSISHRIVMPFGEVRWQRWSDRAIFNKEGDVIEYQSVGRDITRQKEIETQLENYKESLEQRVHDRTIELSATNLKLKKEIEDRIKIQKNLTISSTEKDLLLREVHHRVKNNLQLIIGLVDMTKTRAHEPAVRSTLTDIMTKVQTMGSIHSRLYESKRFDKINMKRQVQDLVDMIAGFYDHDHLDITTNIDCAEIYLTVDRAIPCALALNELISNIHKHAFSGRRSGLVEISSSVKGDQIRFVVRDNGVGLPTGFNIEKSNRLGLKLMRTLVEQQLRGSVTITSIAGTEVVIEFPINQGE